MAWVLIVILRIGGTDLPVTEQVDFSSASACQVAKLEIEKQLTAQESDRFYRTAVLVCAQR